MTRLLVVDASPLARRLIGEAFAAADGVQLAFARSGREALEGMAGSAPDVVVLDLELPGEDGLACLDRIMLERPCPVVMLCAPDSEGAEGVLKGLELGAVDFVQKPQGLLSLEMDAFAPRLRQAVRAAAQVRINPALRLADRVRRRAGGGGPPALRPRPARPPAPVEAAGVGPSEGVVLVGCSTGGPAALEMLLCGLPAGFGRPLVIAQHMPASFTGTLARRLHALSSVQVEEVDTARALRPGIAYIGRGGADVVVARRAGQLLVEPVPARTEARWRPSVDRLVESALEVEEAGRLTGVLMTGMGDDGAAAMARLRREGGATFAQDRASAVVWGMPGALVRAGGAGEVVALDQLAPRLLAQRSASRAPAEGRP